MAELLCEKYAVPHARIRILSNAAFVELQPDVSPRERRGAPSIGFLSAATPEKGVLRFIELARICIGRGLASSAYIAGSAPKQFEATLRAALTEQPAIHYLGGVYGPEKEQFFRTIDLLVFPTAYINEAEPVTLLEAAAAAVPFVATERGCIAEMGSVLGGVTLADGPDFLDRAVQTLEGMLNEATLADLARETQRLFRRENQVALRQRDLIVEEVWAGSRE
jgi:glycosyltransferase involved in cell wall biosynthesis